ncbi:MAG: ribosome small subunit-dependent GTPase A [Polyangiaceae bacterium]|nr:ribosome small subunit-dependent GTPase A [Polyangiaceae bacterium]
MSISPYEPTLAELGFDAFFAEQLAGPEPCGHVARVAVEHRGRYGLLTARGELDAVLSGRLRREAEDDSRLWPRVGDWVELAPDPRDDLALIERVLERRTCFARRAVGEDHRAQIIAANIDIAFVVCAASSSDDERVQRRGANLSRIERYSTAVLQSGARPVCVLNKIDLTANRAALVGSIRAALGERVPLYTTSAITGAGLPELRASIGARETIVLVGPSGAGKSALTNRLLGREVERVGSVRDGDERGRHTTTHRQLFVLPEGGALIDTPGMRELGLTWEGSDLDPLFDDIGRLARRCRFRDCRHAGEPGCAVAAAVESGELDARRLASHQKLARELAHEREKGDPEARRRARRAWRERAVAARTLGKLRPK